jgi:DNA-binding transcriptional ArsR family regulator
MDELSKTLQLLADETRFKVVRILSAGPATVTELVEELGLGQSLVSYHLSLMKDAGIVTTQAKGKWHIYALSDSMKGNTKALVSLIAGSDSVQAGSVDERKPAEEVAVSTTGPRRRSAGRESQPPKDDSASDTATKPKVEDFEDYLL